MINQLADQYACPSISRQVSPNAGGVGGGGVMVTNPVPSLVLAHFERPRALL